MRKFGYKAMFHDMRGITGFNYEVGETYRITNKKRLMPCCNGFHYCEIVDDIFNFFPLHNTVRVFKVEILGKALAGTSGKSCTTKIKIGKELTKKQILGAIKRPILKSMYKETMQ